MYSCGICGVNFRNRTDFNRHMKRHLLPSDTMRETVPVSIIRFTYNFIVRTVDVKKYDIYPNDSRIMSCNFKIYIRLLCKIYISESML